MLGILQVIYFIIGQSVSNCTSSGMAYLNYFCSFQFKKAPFYKYIVCHMCHINAIYSRDEYMHSNMKRGQMCHFA